MIKVHLILIGSAVLSGARQISFFAMALLALVAQADPPTMGSLSVTRGSDGGEESGNRVVLQGAFICRLPRRWAGLLT